LDAAWPRLGRAFRTAPVSRQTIIQEQFVTNRAFPHALPPSPASVLPLPRSRLVFSRCRSSEEKNKPETARKGKTMKLEEIKNKTKDAVDYLVQSLESGHSKVLTQYLGASTEMVALLVFLK
jgi:hypothetical protein